MYRRYLIMRQVLSLVKYCFWAAGLPVGCQPPGFSVRLLPSDADPLSSEVPPSPLSAPFRVTSAIVNEIHQLQYSSVNSYSGLNSGIVLRADCAPRSNSISSRHVQMSRSDYMFILHYGADGRLAAVARSESRT